MKVRIRFSKLGKIRFTSHRDVARMWERALRRADLPVAYTEGFSPRPKLSFGLALSTGHESLGEYLDVDLRPEIAGSIAVDDLPEPLTAAMPAGIDVQAAVTVPPGTPSLQQAVTSCSWRIDVVGAGRDEVTDAVARALAADRIVVTRQRKGQDSEDDLRPGILALAVLPAGSTPDSVALDAELATQPRALRPSELLEALAPEEGRVCRTKQWTLLDGAPREPIPLERADWAPHAEARAS
jgi:radical SAM-linked protein